MTQVLLGSLCSLSLSTACTYLFPVRRQEPPTADLLPEQGPCVRLGPADLRNEALAGSPPFRAGVLFPEVWVIRATVLA